tara:strand:+ start:4895 stop:5365 length:471 start_codon:yes stop_codon:yes gene_type:complete
MKNPEISREKYEHLQKKYDDLEARHTEGGIMLRETIAENKELREKHDDTCKLYEDLKRAYKGLSDGYDRIFEAKKEMAEEISQKRRALNAAVEDQNKQLKTVRRIAQAISTMNDMEQVRMISLLNANQSVCNIVRTLQHENGSISYSLRVERLLGE